MAPDSAETAQQVEQKRQSFRFWVSPPLSASFVFITLLVTQGVHNTASKWVFRVFVIAFLFLIFALVWKELDSQAHNAPIVFFAIGAGLAYIGLAATISQIDLISGAIFSLFSLALIAGCVIIPTDASRQRKQAKATRVRQESPTPSHAKA